MCVIINVSRCYGRKIGFGGVVPLHKIRGSAIISCMEPKSTEPKNQKYENCKRCHVSLADKKGWKFCGQRCSKLYLKSEYKKRNADKIRAYNRKYRKKANDTYFIRSNATRKKIMAEYENECQRCHATENLQLCHIKPHWAGGLAAVKNIYLFCQTCHHYFDKALSDFWEGEDIKQKLSEASLDSRRSKKAEPSPKPKFIMDVKTAEQIESDELVR